jgi:phytoene dehydrogenase-like protein
MEVLFVTTDNPSNGRQPGLIVEFSHRLAGINPRFGKTALQKLVYLAQETRGVPAGYQFTFYNHGPFSSELADDLAYLGWLHAVDIAYLDGGRGGFRISTGPEAERVLAEASDFLRRHAPSIERIVADFGTLTAKDLELRATIVFVERDSRAQSQPLAAETLAEQVQDLKPQFSRGQIRDAIRELAARGNIRVEPTSAGS